MVPEPNTFGRSKSPIMDVHHITWWYNFVRKGSLLDRIYCKECQTYFPSSEALMIRHPKDQYALARQIKHNYSRRKK